VIDGDWGPAKTDEEMVDKVVDEFFADDEPTHPETPEAKHCAGPDEVQNLAFIQRDSLDRAIRKGFDISNTSQQLMLVSDELSEAHDFYRKGQMELFFQPDGKPDGFPVELADAVIRLASLAEYHKIDLGKVIALKAAYNEKRPFKHGKNC
jgi:hypothetical protein